MEKLILQTSENSIIFINSICVPPNDWIQLRTGDIISTQDRSNGVIQIEFQLEAINYDSLLSISNPNNNSLQLTNGNQHNVDPSPLLQLSQNVGQQPMLHTSTNIMQYNPLQNSQSNIIQGNPLQTSQSYQMQNPLNSPTQLRNQMLHSQPNFQSHSTMPTHNPPTPMVSLQPVPQPTISNTQNQTYNTPVAPLIEPQPVQRQSSEKTRVVTPVRHPLSDDEDFNDINSVEETSYFVDSTNSKTPTKKPSKAPAKSTKEKSTKKSQPNILQESKETASEEEEEILLDLEPEETLQTSKNQAKNQKSTQKAKSKSVKGKSTKTNDDKENVLVQLEDENGKQKKSTKKSTGASKKKSTASKDRLPDKDKTYSRRSAAPRKSAAPLSPRVQPRRMSRNAASMTEEELLLANKKAYNEIRKVSKEKKGLGPKTFDSDEDY